MAGSGKTALMQRMNAHYHAEARQRRCAVAVAAR